MPGTISLWFPHVLSMTGNTSGKFSFWSWWEPRLLWVTSMCHRLEVMLRFLHWYNRAIWSFVLHTENLFLQNWCKDAEASAVVKQLYSGSCRVQEGYRLIVFTYCLEFPLRAITNATQISSVVPLTQSPMGMLVHLTYLRTVLIHLSAWETGSIDSHLYLNRRVSRAQSCNSQPWLNMRCCIGKFLSYKPVAVFCSHAVVRGSAVSACALRLCASGANSPGWFG